MNLQECYEAFGGSYEDVNTRLAKDTLIHRLVIKFLDDKTYESLLRAMENKDYGEAFRGAHTLKGLCQNLSFERLGKSASALTELLRNWESEPVDEVMCESLWRQVSEDYMSVVNAIKDLKE